ncbi:HTH domain-containing protein [Candidatus Woesearchaeota archaeon]|jgi:Mn-dependent DtxR family transcriptional regulator|nr:HTH domain-containing protein [Candidatus Woesearchaeota archaeon]MBT5740052.1 HTH domain-containing protein [Candidatus Woesearchaeota archaeon]
MTKKEVAKQIVRLLNASKQPISTREIAEKLNIAWHTADRNCLKLQLKKKVDCFTIGKATAWFKVK